MFNVKKHFLLEQHTEEIKEDISIVKLNTSNSHQVVILLTKYLRTLKRGSFITT